MSVAGLTIAVVSAIAATMTNVFRQKAFDGRDLAAATFWTRIVVTLFYTAALAVRVIAGWHPAVRGSVAAFFLYLALDILLVSACLWLYFRALQLSPLSLCVPFLAYTPVFLIPAAFVLLRELPSLLKCTGVGLVVVGSLLMHRDRFAAGPMQAMQAVVEERGVRYMLGAAFLFAVTSILDRKLLLMSDVFFHSFALSLGVCWVFFLLAMIQRQNLEIALKDNVTWLALAGFGEAAAVLLLFASYFYIPVYAAAGIRRAELLLVVFAAWLFLREPKIADRAIAAAVMLSGVLIFYLPLTALPTFVWASAALAVMVARTFMSARAN